MKILIGNGAVWRKWCTSNACVEVFPTSTVVLVRDSKQNYLGDDQPIISVPSSTWKIFEAEVLDKAVLGGNGRLTVNQLPNGWFELKDTKIGIPLRFNAQEWSAFLDGLAQGYFDPQPLVSHLP